MEAGPRASAAGPLRVFYAAGPGDVVGTFRHWKAGRDDPSQISVTYSQQFFTVCRELGVRATVMSWNPRADREEDGDFLVINRPRHPWTDRGGWRYHLGEQLHLLNLAWTAVRHRADVMLLGGGGHLALLRLLRLGGKQLVVDCPNVLWRTHAARKRSEAVLRRLERGVYRRQAVALTSVSCDVTRQLEEVAGGRPRPILEYLPLYRRDTFRRSPPPPASRPFRVVFAGRVEESKGAPMLAELARRFRAGGRDILIEVCGTGGALPSLQRCVEDEGLGSHLLLHGYCMRDRLSEIYDRSHAVIVPTTSDFIEGFNMVVAEGVLAGRPVVTSAVCPAVNYFGDAVLEVGVDDVDGYQRAVEALAGDAALYERVRSAGAGAGARLFDPANSFGAALRAVLEAVQRGALPAPRTVPVSRATRV